LRDVNSSMEQIDGGQAESNGEMAPLVRFSPHEIPGKEYGWPSRLRSYLVFDPLIWLYTLLM